MKTVTVRHISVETYRLLKALGYIIILVGVHNGSRSVV